MRMNDHKSYVQALEQAEAAQDELAAAQAKAKKAREALARAQAAQEQAARSEHEREEAERAEREQHLCTVARAEHAKAVARVGAAIRELLAAAAQEQAVYWEQFAALEAQMGGQVAAASRVHRYLAPLAVFGTDRYGRSMVSDALETWLVEAKAAGYQV